MAGYTSVPTRINRGILRTTPSISGAVFNTPTPSADPPNSGIGPNMPGHSYSQGSGSPILATPLGTALRLACVVPVCAMITPLPLSALLNTVSPPNLSASENSMGNTITPAPASLKRHTISAMVFLLQGH